MLGARVQDLQLRFQGIEFGDSGSGFIVAARGVLFIEFTA